MKGWLNCKARSSNLDFNFTLYGNFVHIESFFYFFNAMHDCTPPEKAFLILATMSHCMYSLVICHSLNHFTIFSSIKVNQFNLIFRLFGWTIFSWARRFSPSFLITHKTKTTPSKPLKTFFNFRNTYKKNRSFCCSMVLMLARVIIPAAYGLEVIPSYVLSFYEALLTL